MYKQAGLSARAAAPLLALLGSAAVKQTLRRCCAAGGWADKPAAELLTALRDFVEQAEVVHNFEALPPPPNRARTRARLGASGATCVDLALAVTVPYLPNLWEVEYQNATAGLCSNPSENNAEQAVMGFEPFSATRNIIDFGRNVSMPFPASYDEAAQRPVYAAVNLLREDAGSGNFGSVGLVLSRQRVDPMLLLAPQDTGSWECRCNSTAPPWMKRMFPVNCSTWATAAMALGSAGHFDHTLLTSLSCWADSAQLEHLGHVLARVFGDGDGEVNMTTDDQLQGYIEVRWRRWLAGSFCLRAASALPASASSVFSLFLPDAQVCSGQAAGAPLTSMSVTRVRALSRSLHPHPQLIFFSRGFAVAQADVAGVIQFPEAVAMVIGSFRELFGTDAGARLQQWCADHSWPLVWALGPGNETSSFRGLDRIVDVTTLGSARVNRTASASTAAAFELHWQAARAARDRTRSAPGLGSWVQLAEAVGPSLILRALPGGRPCSAAAQCVGIDRHRDCFCARPPT